MTCIGFGTTGKVVRNLDFTYDLYLLLLF